MDISALVFIGIMEDEITYASRLEAAAWLKAFELEEYSAAGARVSVLYIAVEEGISYQPAAFDKARDSMRGVSIQGFCGFRGWPTEPIVRFA